MVALVSSDSKHPSSSPKRCFCFAALNVALLVGWFISCAETRFLADVSSESLEARASDCQLLLDRKGIERECGHKMQPSGVTFLPTHGIVLFGGHEYLIQATLQRPGYHFEVNGCYKGKDLSLGRGDMEAVSGLDFSLAPPPDTRLLGAWRTLKSLDRMLLAIEENYASPCVYLVDSAKLGKGYQESERATVARFRLPRYPSHVEGLAFVPDLTDDLYLGTLFLGTQRRGITSCRIPLADWEREAVCSDVDAEFYASVDSLEYDPTFEVLPGVFGALLVGSDPRGEAVYVDPWEAARGRVVEWSARFRMADGPAGGLRLRGREGHAVYGETAFYAIDDTGGAVGAATCAIANKPASTAERTTGWHPRAPEPSALFSAASAG
eukprot:CAMPEP_0177579784 /NCGR_PEP_ID=MMETSP0419_2-20121207/1164_1 /TAXON_ID=582737 /ORGANISM="Tetraselmis sp., Strain GSL018" /LENGTH=380 /DNA_ID=CAMNT_0019068513 /DNA_START=564 /DNA_END=1702 /DNA_ORIENTATION=-